ncbi:uncharacterized protein KQ657_004139 [Scheffersomyces spartinae]|uniref:Phosducin domain-containing protein n=1 Tax=Scheffersomyces spartinae TaxID=45513 RepID=A0A9P7VBI1_9ASCO|nr:uncharacterized protein KQ657_004139 [Scheffersomyces spartinae]KAG7195026.1 hypothetical protein KQ657_004139 [Scheffersomyces spartinae]
MDNAKFQVQVDPTEDTEWNDILRAHGIIPERPPSPSAQIEEALEEVLQYKHDNRLEDKDLDELDALEDEEDEDFINMYKQRRMAQIKELAKKLEFGEVYPIDKAEYENEVTQASKDGKYVIVHLSLQSNLQSRLLGSLMIPLARKFAEIKMCEIPAQRCIPNYPDSNCPTLIIYHNTNVAKQFITLAQLGGNGTTQKDLEQVLITVGAVADNDKRLIINQDDEDESDGDDRKIRFANKKSIRSTPHNNNNDSDDDFFD